MTPLRAVINRFSAALLNPEHLPTKVPDTFCALVEVHRIDREALGTDVLDHLSARPVADGGELLDQVALGDHSELGRGERGKNQH